MNAAAQANFTLSLEDLDLPVHLGVSDPERGTPQTVRFRIVLYFTDALAPFSKSDQVEDGAICYEALSQKLSGFLKPRSFHLVEFLGREVFLFLKEVLPQSLEFSVDITKIKPPTTAELGRVTARFATAGVPR